MLHAAWLTPHYSLWRERRVVWNVREGSGGDGVGGEGGTEAIERLRTPFAHLLRPDGGLQVSLFNSREQREDLIASLPANHPDTAILLVLIQKNAFWAFGEFLGNMGSWGNFAKNKIPEARAQITDPALGQAFEITLQELDRRMALEHMAIELRKIDRIFANMQNNGVFDKSTLLEIQASLKDPALSQAFGTAIAELESNWASTSQAPSNSRISYYGKLGLVLWHRFTALEREIVKAEDVHELRSQCREEFWNLWRFYFLLESSNVSILMEDLYRNHPWLERRPAASGRNRIYPPGCGEEAKGMLPQKRRTRSRIAAMLPMAEEQRKQWRERRSLRAA